MIKQISKRWVFWQWFNIPDRTDPTQTYLRRLRLIQTPYFAVYIHWIYLPDRDRDFHDHPWNFWSFILKGWYNEVIVPDRQELKHRHRFSWHKMSKMMPHRITMVAPGTVSLVITGRRTRTWGFITPSDWIPWDEYIREEFNEDNT